MAPRNPTNSSAVAMCSTSSGSCASPIAVSQALRNTSDAFCKDNSINWVTFSSPSPRMSLLSRGFKLCWPWHARWTIEAAGMSRRILLMEAGASLVPYLIKKSAWTCSSILCSSALVCGSGCSPVGCMTTNILKLSGVGGTDVRRAPRVGV